VYPLRPGDSELRRMVLAGALTNLFQKADPV
jgi:hypothetical protein